MNLNEIGIRRRDSRKGSDKVFRRLGKKKFINYEEEFSKSFSSTGRKMSSMGKGGTLF